MGIQKHRNTAPRGCTRELVSIRATIQQETAKFNNQKVHQEDTPQDKVLSEYLRQQKPHGVQQLEPSWGGQAPGIYHCQKRRLEKVDITEGLIITAEEQAPPNIHVQKMCFLYFLMQLFSHLPSFCTVLTPDTWMIPHIKDVSDLFRILM